MHRTLFIGLLCCASAVAQTQPASKQTDLPSSALMSRIIAAWNTGDPANAAPFYDKEPANVYFDFAPLEYKGWNEFDAGVRQALAMFQSLKFALHDRARVHRAGGTAWGTATWTAQGKLNNGNLVSLQGRWTCIWEKRGANWRVVHEHFSVPWMPEPESRHR
jgi:ketosteroid isomerase-like protein